MKPETLNKLREKGYDGEDSYISAWSWLWSKGYRVEIEADGDIGADTLAVARCYPDWSYSDILGKSSFNPYDSLCEGIDRLTSSWQQSDIFSFLDSI